MNCTHRLPTLKRFRADLRLSSFSASSLCAVMTSRRYSSVNMSRESGSCSRLISCNDYPMQQIPQNWLSEIRLGILSPCLDGVAGGFLVHAPQSNVVGELHSRVLLHLRGHEINIIYFLFHDCVPSHVVVDDPRPEPGRPVEGLGGRVVLPLPDPGGDVGEDDGVDVVGGDDGAAPFAAPLATPLAPPETEVAAVADCPGTVLHHGYELGRKNLSDDIVRHPPFQIHTSSGYGFWLVVSSSPLTSSPLLNVRS